MTSSNLQSNTGLSLLTKYSEGNSAGKAAKDKRSLSSFSLVFISLLPSSLSLCHMSSTTQVMQNEAELIANKQHKQMLCQALAGATLMQASTVKLCLVINKIPISNTCSIALFHLVISRKFWIQLYAVCTSWRNFHVTVPW